MPDLEIRFVHLGHAYGQHDWRLAALEEGIEVGYVTFAEYEGIPHVLMIEVAADHRRNGIGSNMVAELQRRYEGTAIDFGGLTEDGDALLASLPWIVLPNEERIAAETELERVDAVLEAHSRKWNAAVLGSEDDRAKVLKDVSDWNKLSDASEELARRLADEPSEFRYVDFEAVLGQPMVANP